MPIEDWMPECDESSGHSIRIDAPVQIVWETLQRADLTGHPLTRVLMLLRAIPALIFNPRRTLKRVSRRRKAPGGLETMLGEDLALLEKTSPTSIVLGLTGRFWTPSGELLVTDPHTFREPVPEGVARAAWAFELREEDRWTILSTQTRVRCGGTRARRAFRLYWSLIRPFSGLIRIVILGQIARLVDQRRRPETRK